MLNVLLAVAALVAVGGASFAMYTQNDGAWVKNAAEEAKLAAVGGYTFGAGILFAPLEAVTEVLADDAAACSELSVTAPVITAAAPTS